MNLHGTPVKIIGNHGKVKIKRKLRTNEKKVNVCTNLHILDFDSMHDRQGKKAERKARDPGD